MPIQDVETRITEDERRSTESIPEEPRDPGFYRINPRAEIPVEHFEGDEEAITDWEGASIDFGLGEAQCQSWVILICTQALIHQIFPLP